MGSTGNFCTIKKTVNKICDVAQGPRNIYIILNFISAMSISRLPPQTEQRTPKFINDIFSEYFPALWNPKQWRWCENIREELLGSLLFPIFCAYFIYTSRLHFNLFLSSHPAVCVCKLHDLTLFTISSYSLGKCWFIAYALWYWQEKKSSAKSSNYIHTDTHAHTHTHKTLVEFWLSVQVTSFSYWSSGKCNSEEPNTEGNSMPKIRKCLT